MVVLPPHSPPSSPPGPRLLQVSFAAPPSPPPSPSHPLPALPTRQELRLLEGQRLLAKRRRKVARVKDELLQRVSWERAMQRVRMEYKRRYKRRRLAVVESRAIKRIITTLIEADEQRGGGGTAAAAAGGGRTAQGGRGGAAGGSRVDFIRQPGWAGGGSRRRVESASTLVRAVMKQQQQGAAGGAAGGAGSLPFSGIFDHMIIVGLPCESVKEGLVTLGSTYGPQVVYSFPESVVCAEAVPEFCLPSGVTIRPYTPPPTATITTSSSHVSWASSSSSSAADPLARRLVGKLVDVKEYVFVLSGGGADGSEVSYGMCLHASRVYAYGGGGGGGGGGGAQQQQALVQGELCYCFISQHAFLPLHLSVLREIVRLHLLTNPQPDTTMHNHHHAHHTPLSPPSSSSAGKTSSTSSTVGGTSAQQQLLQPGGRSSSSLPLPSGGGGLDESEVERAAIIRITDVLQRFAVLPVPAPGQEIEFSPAESTPHALSVPLFFRRPVLQAGDDDEAWHFLREWSVPVLLNLMSLDNVLLALLCMLTEIQLVVVCPDLQLLSASVLSMIGLLRPLVWAGPLIVTLPQKLYGYLDSPVPLVIGVEQLPQGFSTPQGMVVLTPLDNSVHFHPKEADSYKQLVWHQVCHLVDTITGQEARSSRHSATHYYQQQHQWTAAAGGLRRGGATATAADPQHQQQPSSSSSAAHTSAAAGATAAKQQQEEEDADTLLSPPRPKSPAFRNRPLNTNTSGESSASFLFSSSTGTSSSGGRKGSGPSSSSSRGGGGSSHPPPPRGGGALMQQGWVDAMVWRIRDHLSAICHEALSLDLTQRPKRPPVLDRRRSTVVEVEELDEDTRYWWEDCLGPNGPTFMKRVMDSQMYCNYRYSDAIRKRSVPVALGGSNSPRARASHARKATRGGGNNNKGSGGGKGGETDNTHDGSSMDVGGVLPLTEEQQTTYRDLFEMAIFGAAPSSLTTEQQQSDQGTTNAGGTAADAVTAAGAAHRPCNGMCSGRIDTAECTLLCLEAWENRVIHLRRKAIIRAGRMLASATSSKNQPYAEEQFVWQPHKHSRESSSQFRLRLQRLHGDALLPIRKKWRIKGRKAIRYQKRRRLRVRWRRVARHAGIVILTAFKKNLARRRAWQLVYGVTLLQAVFRGYRTRKEARALRVMKRSLRRYVGTYRRRLQQLSLKAADLKMQQQQQQQQQHQSRFLLGKDKKGTAVPALSVVKGAAPPPPPATPAKKDVNLWGYLLRRRNSNDNSNGGAGAAVQQQPAPPLTKIGESSTNLLGGGGRGGNGAAVGGGGTRFGRTNTTQTTSTLGGGDDLLEIGGGVPPDNGNNHGPYSSSSTTTTTSQAPPQQPQPSSTIGSSSSSSMTPRGGTTTAPVSATGYAGLSVVTTMTTSNDMQQQEPAGNRRASPTASEGSRMATSGDDGPGGSGTTSGSSSSSWMMMRTMASTVSGAGNNSPASAARLAMTGVTNGNNNNGGPSSMTAGGGAVMQGTSTSSSSTRRGGGLNDTQGSSSSNSSSRKGGNSSSSGSSAAAASGGGSLLMPAVVGDDNGVDDNNHHHTGGTPRVWREENGDDGGGGGGMMTASQHFHFQEEADSMEEEGSTASNKNTIPNNNNTKKGGLPQPSGGAASGAGAVVGSGGGGGLVVVDPEMVEELRRGVRVVKYSKTGKPQRRVLYLQESSPRKAGSGGDGAGSSSSATSLSSPTIAWRPESSTPFGAFKRLILRTSAIQLPQVNQVSTGINSPRLSHALSKGQLHELRGNQQQQATGGGGGGAVSSSSVSLSVEDRYLTLTVQAPDRTLEMELVKPEGMSDAQASTYHHRVVRALEGLVANSRVAGGAPPPPTTT